MHLGMTHELQVRSRVARLLVCDFGKLFAGSWLADSDALAEFPLEFM